MQFMRYHHFRWAICLLIGFALISIKLYTTKIQYTSKPSGRNKVSKTDFWNDTLDFTFYVRMTHSPRYSEEYRRILIQSMRLFVPNNAARLVVALDNEKASDHKFGQKITNEWPYPKICYMEQGDPQTYYGLGKVRMYLDMMYADNCTDAIYVGFIDTDTLFDTLLTQQLLFEGGKPVVIAKIGAEPSGLKCWAATTARFLGKKQVMNCMAAFPVIVKTSHLREMRAVLSRLFGKPFDRVFQDSCIEKYDCLSQFSMICNYLWYHHRSEYSWHLQIVPNGYWDGMDIIEGQVDPDYYRKEIEPSMLTPMPRSSLHLRYMIVNGITYAYKYPNEDAINDIIQEGLCYSAGFDYCPHICTKWNENRVQHYLFSFEYDSWNWDNQCKEKQIEHYDNVKEIVRTHFQYGLEIFGVSSIQEFCHVVQNWKL